ncbi:MAG: hypothetical protein ACJ8DJ_18680, partial [Gemmatimonadales bacterium]
AHEREFDRSLEQALSEEARAKRYRQRQATIRAAGAGDHPRPLEFDDSGFPIRQGNSTFLARVSRLLSPG